MVNDPEVYYEQARRLRRALAYGVIFNVVIYGIIIFLLVSNS